MRVPEGLPSSLDQTSSTLFWVMFVVKFPLNSVPSVNILFVIVVTTKHVTLCTFSIVFYLREQFNFGIDLRSCSIVQMMQMDRFR
jgi:hypothetical protein